MRGRVGQPRPLVPEMAIAGDIGRGRSVEKGTDFAWRVMARPAKAYR
jgi:hypothetical protein